MMGGLAYMTGLPDRPLRVGSSVNDIMGGMFAAIGILAALRERDTTGRGKLVKSALFENTAYLVAQHMAQFAITGEAPPPMSVKKPAWGVYDIFETKDTGEGKDAARLFVGVVTDTQWEVFCREFALPEFAGNAELRTNGQRVKNREWLIPRIGEVFKRWTREDLEQKLESIGLPYAPISRPWDLFDDPHLNASGGLVDMRVSPGKSIRVPTLPLELDGERLGLRNDPPSISENAREVLAEAGYSAAQIDSLIERGIVTAPA
jgi:crotonobetainyl-CoA:carnitine CoA-transferase CaiB-like acyl-CoA transferase